MSDKNWAMLDAIKQFDPDTADFTTVKGIRESLVQLISESHEAIFVGNCNLKSIGFTKANDRVFGMVKSMMTIVGNDYDERVEKMKGELGDLAELVRKLKKENEELKKKLG